MVSCIYDFLKIEKVELTVFEKGEKQQESTHLLRVYCPKRRSFYPVPPAAPVGRFFARRQLRRALYLAFLAVSRLSLSLSPAGNLLSNHSHTTAFLSFRCPFRYVVPSSAMMAHSAGDCPLSEHKKQWFFVSAWSITLSAGALRLPGGGRRVAPAAKNRLPKAVRVRGAFPVDHA